MHASFIPLSLGAWIGRRADCFWCLKVLWSISSLSSKLKFKFKPAERGIILCNNVTAAGGLAKHVERRPNLAEGAPPTS